MSKPEVPGLSEQEPVRVLDDTGCIPAFTVCQFRHLCVLALDGCEHLGEKHDRPYSCAAARGFQLVSLRVPC